MVKFKIKRKSSNKFDEIAPVGNSRYRVRITELHIQSMERSKRFNFQCALRATRQGGRLRIVIANVRPHLRIRSGLLSDVSIPIR